MLVGASKHKLLLELQEIFLPSLRRLCCGILLSFRRVLNIPDQHGVGTAGKKGGDLNVGRVEASNDWRQTART